VGPRSDVRYPATLPELPDIVVYEVRIAYVIEVPKLERAMKCLGAALAAYPRSTPVAQRSSRAPDRARRRRFMNRPGENDHRAEPRTATVPPDDD
jgi:hypothetical protein